MLHLARVVILLLGLPSMSGAFSMESLSTAPTNMIASDDETMAKDYYFNQPSAAEDNFFRSLRQNTPVSFQYFLRDSGFLRFLADTLTWTTVAPAIVREHPATISRFLKLSGLSPAVPRNEQQQHECRVQFQSLKYGAHARQSVHLMQPCKDSKSGSEDPQQTSPCHDHLVLFVHGGAWGSGTPDMYRLVATPFLEQDMAVAVAGYRTYPDGTVQDQVHDVVAALQQLQDEGKVNHGKTKITLIGHSSGAHVSALALLCNPAFRTCVDCFVGLAGVYDIPSHYQYERLRGVERFSPMAAACGRLVGGATTRTESKLTPLQLLQSWKRASPTRMARMVAPSLDDSNPFPETLILHGGQDMTVPVESPIRFAASLRGAVGSNDDDVVDLAILPQVGHVDFVTDLMFGGPSKNIVLDWMKSKGSMPQARVP